jgi:hypothetical protein
MEPNPEIKAHEEETARNVVYVLSNLKEYISDIDTKLEELAKKMARSVSDTLKTRQAWALAVDLFLGLD